MGDSPVLQNYFEANPHLSDDEKDQITQLYNNEFNKPTSGEDILANAPKSEEPIALPNGGLEGKQLEDYIKKNPGPVATTGFNPNNPGNVKEEPSEDESDDEEISPIKSSSKNIPSKELPKETESKQEDIPESTNNLQDLLSNVYGSDRNDEALKAAMKHRDDVNLNSEIGKAFNLIGSSVASSSGGGIHPHNELFDSMEKNANNDVQDILTLRKGNSDKQALISTIMKNANEQDKVNPNSPISQLYRDSLKKMSEQAGMPISIPPNLTAGDAEKYFPTIEKYTQNKYSKDESAANAKYRQQSLDLQRQQLNNEKKQRFDTTLLGNTQREYNGNKNIVQLKQGVEAADAADQLLEEARLNPSAANQAPIVLARLSTNGQRLNQAEIHNSGGSKAMIDKINQAFKTAGSGTMTDENYQNAKNLINIYRNAAQKSLHSANIDFAKQYSKKTGKPLDESYEDLTGNPFKQDNNPSLNFNQDAIQAEMKRRGLLKQ